MTRLEKMLNRLRTYLLADLWRRELDVGYRRWLHPVLRLTMVMVQELAGGQLALRAMSLVYLTLVSLVPLLAVSFSVLKAFGVHDELEPLLLNYLSPLGDKGTELAHHILSFVSNMKVGVLGSVGLGILLYTVISLTQKVESTFNEVWHVTQLRRLSRRFADYLSVILVGPVLAFTALGITASMNNSHVVKALGAIPGFGLVVLLLGKLIPFLLIIGTFTFVYMFMPNTRVKLSAALCGAVVCGVLWEASGMFFAAFIAGSGHYTAIYSGFAILMLFMIWLYLSWFILLFGAHISYYYQHPRTMRLGREASPLSWRQRERAGLALLTLVAQAHYRGEKLWTLGALAERLALPDDMANRLLAPLLQGGILVEGGDDDGLLPACDPARISVGGVLELMRQAGEDASRHDFDDTDLAVVDTTLASLSQARDEAVAGMTMRDLGGG